MKYVALTSWQPKSQFRQGREREKKRWRCIADLPVICILWNNWSKIKEKVKEIQFLLEVAGELQSYFCKEKILKKYFNFSIYEYCFLTEIQFLSNRYENWSVMRRAKFRYFYSKNMFKYVTVFPHKNVSHVNKFGWSHKIKKKNKIAFGRCGFEPSR